MNIDIPENATSDQLRVLLEVMLLLSQPGSVREKLQLSFEKIGMLPCCYGLYLFSCPPQAAAGAGPPVLIHQWGKARLKPELPETFPAEPEPGHFIALTAEAVGEAPQGTFYASSVPVASESQTLLLADWSSERDFSVSLLSPFVQALGGMLSQEKAAEELAVQRDYLQAVIDHLPGLVFCKDYEGRFTLVNKRVAEIYGAPPGELLGKTDLDFNPFPAEVDRYLAEDQKVIREKETVWLPEDYIITPSGQRIDLQTVKVPIQRPGQQQADVLGIAIDVSYWRGIEAREQRQRLQYENFIHHASEGIYYVACEPPIPCDLPPEEQTLLYYERARFEHCNESMARMYHLDSAESLIGMRIMDLHKGSGFDHNWEVTLRFFESGMRIWGFETCEQLPDGTTAWFANHTVGIVEGGQLVGIWGGQLDITAQKKIELSLLHKQAELELVLEGARVATWEWDIPEEAARFNDYFAIMLGYQLEELPVSPQGFNRELVHPRDLSGFIRAAQEYINYGKEDEVFEYEIRLKKKDGGYKWLLARGRPVGWEGKGRPTRGRGIFIDIDERKQTELRLKRQQEMLTLVSESTEVAFWEWTPGEPLAHLSATFFKVLGHEKPQSGWLDLSAFIAMLHPDDRSAFEAYVLERLKTPEKGFEAEVRIQQLSGRFLWVYCRGELYHLEGQERIAGLIINIDERKRAELNLVRSQERTNLILDAAELGLWEWNPTTGHCFFSAHWAGMLGYEQHELAPRLETFWELVHPDDRLGFAPQLNDHLEGKIPYFEVELRMRNRSGDWVWVYDQGRIVRYNREGQPTLLAGVHININERKQAERDLAEREAFFRSLYEDSPLGIFICDADGLILQANNRAYQVLGYPRDTLAGTLLESLGTEPGIMDGVKQAQEQTHQVYKVERPLQHKSGRVIWANLMFSLLLDADGDMRYIICSVEDITARVKAEEELRSSRQLKRAIIEALPDLKFRIDRSGHFVSYFATVSESLSLLMQPDDFLGKKLEEVLPPYLASGLRQNLERALASHKVQAFEYPLLMSDGLKHYEARVNAINEEEVIVVIRDITDLKNMERDLKQKLEELAANNDMLTKYVESNAQLENFAHTVSHDLREPVRTMNSFARLLQARYREKLDDDAHAYLDFISESASHMNKQIEDLLEFARLTNSESPGYEEVDLNRLIEVIRRALRGLIADKAAVIDLPETPLPVVLGNPTKLGQLFQNLISNGIKFHKPGVPPVVSLRYEELPDRWQFEVSDNGIGIPQEQQGQVFLLFRRLHSKKVYPGSGIGLALCKRVVEQHGGEIEVFSAPGEGATFRFTLDKKY